MPSLRMRLNSSCEVADARAWSNSSAWASRRSRAAAALVAMSASRSPAMASKRTLALTTLAWATWNGERPERSATSSAMRRSASASSTMVFSRSFWNSVSWFWRAAYSGC